MAFASFEMAAWLAGKWLEDPSSKTQLQLECVVVVRVTAALVIAPLNWWLPGGDEQRSSFRRIYTRDKMTHSSCANRPRQFWLT